MLTDLTPAMYLSWTSGPGARRFPLEPTPRSPVSGPSCLRANIPSSLGSETLGL